MLSLSLFVVAILIGILWLTHLEEKRSHSHPTMKAEELWTWADRRNQKRVPRIVPVLYALRNSSCVQPSRSQDISGGGIQVVLPEKLSPGTELELEFSLSETEEPFRVVGQVVWMMEITTEGDQRLFRTGFRFLRMEEKESERLKRFLYEKRGS